jgi:hypothetical protein
MRENSIFTITPPDMILNESGPTVTVVSMDESFINKIESINENLFKTVPVNIYHPNGEVTEKKLAWLLSVMRLSDTIYVDLSTVNDLGLLTSIFCGNEVIYINVDKKRKDIAKLFNSVQQEGFQVYDSLDEYLEIMLVRLGLK